MIDLQRPTWSNAKHAAQWTSTLTTYAFPKIGSKLVTDITTADILAVLTPIWTEKPETVSRVRQSMETVLDWAGAQGYRMDNPANRSITKVLHMGSAPSNTIRRCITALFRKRWKK